MLHESIHAYLIAYYANNSSANGTGFQGQYPAIALAYLTYNATVLESSHHTEMAIGGPSNGWIGDIAWTLKQYGIDKGYNLPDQFYMDLAWSELTTTAAFNSLSAADKTRIKDLIAAECYGTNNQGLSATQMGTKACN